MELNVENTALREALELAYLSIEEAIYCNEGLDGGEGESVLKMIAKVHPAAKEKADKILNDVLAKSKAQESIRSRGLRDGE